MKHNIYKGLLSATAIIMLAGCEKENNFLTDTGNGQLDCKSLNVGYINGQTRATGVDVDDFTINFINTTTGKTERSFKYSEMPEIVTLPVGDYKAEALFGDNPIADWESPYYLGNSEFNIQAGKITDNIEPVECTLSNIRIAVDVDDLGLGILGDDVKVVVKAGKEGELTFDKITSGKSGYFRYVENSNTITAVFSGTVDGEYIEGETRTYSNAAPGKAYKINFNVNRPDNVEPGDIDTGDITIDASITIRDVTRPVDPGEPDDDILIDDMRPVDGSDEPGPGDDPNPGTDPQPAAGPEIVSESAGMELDKPYEVAEGSEVKFKVTSKKGITEFKIVIESSTLTPETLEGVGLTDKLDLINPGEFEESLNNLGFPTGTNVEGKTEVSFDISQFVPLLGMLGSGEHKFHLTVSDEDGTTTGTIWLKN